MELVHDHVQPRAPALQDGSTVAGCLLSACWGALGRSAPPGLSFPTLSGAQVLQRVAEGAGVV